MNPDRPTRSLVYEAILNFINTNGYSPSVREVARAVGKTESTVQVHIDHLIAQGFLTRREGQSRTLRPVCTE